MTKERFLVPSSGPDVTTVSIGIEALNLLCEKYQSNGLVVVPALKHASSTILNNVWPEKQIKALSSGKRLKLPCGYSVAMCSPFTLKNHTSSKVILALFASKEMIEKAENACGCSALVVIPWIPEDAETWVRTHTPIELSIS
jgi:hypothetical protein